MVDRGEGLEEVIAVVVVVVVVKLCTQSRNRRAQPFVRGCPHVINLVSSELALPLPPLYSTVPYAVYRNIRHSHTTPPRDF